MTAQAGYSKIDPHSDSFLWNHLIYRLIEQAECLQSVHPELLLALFVCSIRQMGVMVNNHHHHECFSRFKCSATGSLTLLVFMLDWWLLIFGVDRQSHPDIVSNYGAYQVYKVVTSIGRHGKIRRWWILTILSSCVVSFLRIVFLHPN